MEDHPFSNLLTEVKWEALKKQPRDDNPLEERYVAAPFKIDHSCHLLAGLLQVVGVLAPSPCRTCEKDCGRWATCVISYDHSSIDIAKGACANCLYTSAGRGCSSRKFPRSVKDEHVQTCEYWFCKRCLTIMLKTERDAHLQQCERWCCGRCLTTMSKSKKDQHLQTCEYWRCFRCGYYYLASTKNEHKSECAEALPACCSHCGKHGPHDDVSKHEAECDVRTCPSCTHRLRVNTIQAHWETCTKIKCPGCTRVVDRNEPHDCSKQHCSICHTYFPRGCEDDHLRHCKGFKKIDALCSDEELGRAIRSILSQGFRFPLLEGCAQTLTMCLKHPPSKHVYCRFRVHPLG